MRYPLWAFFFFLVMPPFTAHALLSGHAALHDQDGAGYSVANIAQTTAEQPAWSVTSSRIR